MAPAPDPPPTPEAVRRATWRRPVVLFILAITIIIPGTSAIIWHKVIRDHFIPKRFGTVEPGRIYRSGQLTPRMIEHICTTHNIRTIIALNGRSNNPHTRAEAAYAAQHNIDRYTFNLHGDGTGDPLDYAQVLTLMSDPAHQPVLIHCSAGAQRAGIATLLYRNIIQGTPIRDAYPETLRYDHDADEWTLLAYIADHLDTIRHHTHQHTRTAEAAN